jgi:hypothetical protein
MDMAGPMPDAAWFEVRSASGELLESIAARIEGGGIYGELPGFAPGTLGSIHLCMRWADGTVARKDLERERLPTEPTIQLHQIG